MKSACMTVDVAVVQAFSIRMRISFVSCRERVLITPADLYDY